MLLDYVFPSVRLLHLSLLISEGYWEPTFPSYQFLQEELVGNHVKTLKVIERDSAHHSPHQILLCTPHSFTASPVAADKISQIAVVRAGVVTAALYPPSWRWVLRLEDARGYPAQGGCSCGDLPSVLIPWALLVTSLILGAARPCHRQQTAWWWLRHSPAYGHHGRVYLCSGRQETKQKDRCGS